MLIPTKEGGVEYKNLFKENKQLTNLLTQCQEVLKEAEWVEGGKAEWVDFCPVCREANTYGDYHADGCKLKNILTKLSKVLE